jgi:N-acetylglutamate synthase-like GNAT family acetyltransferase
MEHGPLTPSDAGEASRIWNDQFPHDAVTEARFREVFLSPPSFDPASTPTIRVRGRLTGFASLFRDGRTAHLRGLVAEAGNPEVLELLLARVMNRARELGCDTVRVVTGHGAPYVYAAIDSRHAAMTGWYSTHGFSRVEEIKDMRIDLTQPVADDKLARLASGGIVLRDFEPRWLPSMRPFIPAAEVAHWFPDGWESTWPEGGRSVLAMAGDEVIGYADWAIRNGHGEFGPTAVRLDRREQGIGTGLLLTAMLRMKAAGAATAYAKWVWPVELYSRNGWQVERTGIVFEAPVGPS